MGEQFNLFCPDCKAVTNHFLDYGPEHPGDIDGFQYGICERCKRRNARAVLQVPPRKPKDQHKVYVYSGGTVQRLGRKVGRNDPCPCGSGKKFKSCHAGVQKWGWDLRVVTKRGEKETK